MGYRVTGSLLMCKENNIVGNGVPISWQVGYRVTGLLLICKQNNIVGNGVFLGKWVIGLLGYFFQNVKVTQ